MNTLSCGQGAIDGYNSNNSFRNGAGLDGVFACVK